MSQMFRLFFAPAIFLGATLVTAEEADARKFRFGGGSKSRSYSQPVSRSSTTIVVVPTYRGSSSYSRDNGDNASNPLDSNGIQLVYDMPNTPDYAYGSGHFDVGFRKTEDDGGDYVIYAGPHFMQLKPKLQGQIAERLGFDPVEEHKKVRRERGEQVPEEPKAAGAAAAKKPMMLASASVQTANPKVDSGNSSSMFYAIVTFCVLAVVGLLAMWKLTSDRDGDFVGSTRDSRIDSRLKGLRA